MNILCDQCVHRDIVFILRKSGFNTIHASEVRLSRASDMDIFRYAQRSRRILLTFDHGFGNITQFPIRNSPGVVLIYVAEMNNQTIINRTLYVFDHLLKHRQATGKLFIIDSESIRIWPKE